MCEAPIFDDSLGNNVYLNFKQSDVHIFGAFCALHFLNKTILITFTFCFQVELCDEQEEVKLLQSSNDNLYLVAVSTAEGQIRGEKKYDTKALKTTY